MFLEKIIHTLLSDKLLLHSIKPRHLSESHRAFIKLPLLHSVFYFYSKWRSLEGRLTIYCRESNPFCLQDYLPNLPWELKSSLILISYWLKNQIYLYFLVHRFGELKSFFHFCLCPVYFCNFLDFLGDGYNYGRGLLNDQEGTSFLSAQWTWMNIRIMRIYKSWTGEHYF